MPSVAQASACWHNPGVDPGADSAQPSADDPAFWDDWYADDELRPPGWDEMTGKQRCVVVHARDEESLNEMLAYFLGQEVDGHVMAEVGRHEDHGVTSWSYALRPGKEWKPCEDAAALGALAPEFSAVVRDLIVSGLVEIRQVPGTNADFDNAPPLPTAQVDGILADVATWVPDGDTGCVKIALAGRSKRKTLSGPDL